MKSDDTKFPFQVPDGRFDQKFEMFKRARWDEAIAGWARSSRDAIVFEESPGLRQRDFALRNAAWNIEFEYGRGNSMSNSGLYSWSHVSDKTQPFIDAGRPVTGTPVENASCVKQAARFLGADLVGICYAHPNLVYSHEYNIISQAHYPLDLPEDHVNAVVLAIAMDYTAMRHSPNAVAGAATGFGYSKMASTANMVATFIRGLGYEAVPSGNDTALSVPLAAAAGLGEVGRLGLLVTEKYGPRVRICKVFTNMPLAHDEYRPFGVTEFCRVCMKCARHCPSNAVSSSEPTTSGWNISNHSGPRKWYVDAEKCYRFWAKNRMDCTNCINVCPFNKPSGLLHDGVRALIKHQPVFNRMVVRLDDVLGYGKPMHRKEYWEA
ncbi:MAG: reductive dehalogenase [Desulfobacteraceae bacterium]|nr:reductive dehalogenase [Desulfobacteraceae bacterium]